MGGLRTPRPGVNIPAVTTKFVRTKADILNGKNTASPVSNHMKIRFECNAQHK